MSEQAPLAVNQFSEIQQQQYSNGNMHLYGVDTAGKKTHLSWEDVAAQYGVEVSQPLPNSDDSASDVSAQDRLRSHANWKMKVNTSEVKDGKISGPASAEDIAYDAWLNEHASGDHKGRSLTSVLKAEAEDAKVFERREQKRDWARLEMRVNTGAASAEELERYHTMKGLIERDEAEATQNDHPDQDNGENDSPDSDNNTPENPGNTLTPEAIQAAEGNRFENLGVLAELRADYLRRVAGRARRGIHLKKEFRESAIEDAQRQYEEFRDALYAGEIGYLRDTGLDPETIDQVMTVFAFDEQRKLAKELHKLRLEATGNYEITEHTRKASNGQVAAWTEAESVKKGVLGRTMNKFYNWFGSVNPSGKLLSKGGIKKAAVMAGVGAAAGLAFAPLAGAAAAGIGGGVLISRITKAYMSAHVNQKGKDANALHADQRLRNLLNQLGNGTNGAEMTGLIGDQTATEVRHNRRRTALGATAVALGFGAGALAHELIPKIDIDNPFGSHHTPNNGGGSKPKPDHHTHTGEGVKPKDFELHKGHTIWGDVSDYAADHGVKLTNHQTYDVVNSVLKQNGLSWEDARHLPVGYDWHMNPAILEELSKSSELPAAGA